MSRYLAAVPHTHSRPQRGRRRRSLLARLGGWYRR